MPLYKHHLTQGPAQPEPCTLYFRTRTGRFERSNYSVPYLPAERKEKMNGLEKMLNDDGVFNKIYSECMEDAPQAPKEIKDAFSAMHDAFEEYLCAIGEYNFRYAYQCGYKAAMREKSGGIRRNPGYLLKDTTSTNEDFFRKRASEMLAKVDDGQIRKIYYLLLEFLGEDL